jgi:hypothetical protein
MLAGAEAETWIEGDGGLAFDRFFFAPAWFDEELFSDADGLEKFLPGLGPVLAFDFGDADFGRVKVEAIHLDFGEAATEFFFDAFQLGAGSCEVNSDQADEFFVTGIDGGSFFEGALQEFGDGIFGFAGSDDGNFGQGNLGDLFFAHLAGLFLFAL